MSRVPWCHSKRPHIRVPGLEDGGSLGSILQVADKAWDTRNSPASSSASDNSFGTTTGVPGGLTVGLASISLTLESGGAFLERHNLRINARKNKIFFQCGFRIYWWNESSLIRFPKFWQGAVSEKFL